MPSRRPNRRGDWGRRLSSFSILDSPISSDSDGFPCDSSCSGDSFSSQDYCLSDRRPRRVRSTPPSHLSSLFDSPSFSPTRTISHPNDLAHIHRPDLVHPKLAPLDIRDLSLSEYTAAELPDIGIFLKGMLPGFGNHSLPPYPTQASRSPRDVRRRRSVPSSAFRKQPNSLRTPRDSDRLRNRPPTFPDSGRPSQMQVQFAKTHEVLLPSSYSREQSPRKSPRHDSNKRLRRPFSPNSSRTPRLSPKVDTRRYPDDIAISRQVAQRRDPDSMQRSLLAERLLSMYNGFVGIHAHKPSSHR